MGPQVDQGTNSMAATRGSAPGEVDRQAIGSPGSRVSEAQGALGGAQDEPPADFLPEPDQEELAPIDAKLLKRASRSFPARTAQTWDGFHPRHFAFLNEEELEAVCELLNWVERHGKMPTQIWGMLRALMMKANKTGSGPAFRSIGVLPALYRVWAKARQYVVKEWEECHKAPYMAHQKGQSILELVFKQSLWAEAMTTQESTTFAAAFLWDLSNFL